MKLEELAKLYPEMAYKLAVKGSAFALSMGEEWASSHPRVFLFLDPPELKQVLDGGGLQPAVIVKSMERFLSRPEVFEESSPEVASIRETYRDLLPAASPGYLEGLEERIRASVKTPEVLVGLVLVAMSLSPVDPRQDPQSAMLWFMAGWGCAQLRDQDRAAWFLEHAVRLDPKSVVALNELAVARLNQKRPADAAALLKESLRLDPDNAFAAELARDAGLDLA